MRRSKFTIWLENDYPKDKSKSKTALSKHYKIPKKLLDEAFDRGVGAYVSNFSAVRPGVKKLDTESGKQVWGKEIIYNSIKKYENIRKREGNKVKKGRRQDFDLVEKAI